MKIWVVLPTYNEAENLPLMVHTLLHLKIERQPQLATSSHRATPPTCDCSSISTLVVDDNSPDGTGKLADRLALEHPAQLHVIHRPGKLGLGSAYLQGFTFALDHGADVVVEMDADFSHSPSDLPSMIALLKEYDVVVGSRWCPGGRLDEKWELWRYLLSKYANVYARLATGLHVRDTTAGFKVFRAEALRRVPYQRMRSNGYAFQIEMATACQRAGLRVTEFPIYFEERVRGRSKMTVGIILDAVWRVWQIRFRW